MTGRLIYVWHKAGEIGVLCGGDVVAVTTIIIVVVIIIIATK